MRIQAVVNGVPVEIINISTVGPDTYMSYIPKGLDVSATQVKVEKRTMDFGTSALILGTSATIIS